MLTAQPLDALANQLASILAALNLQSMHFGQPEIVRKAADAAAAAFQGYAKAKPSKEDAYAAALAFMRGYPIDERQRDVMASALCERIREQANGCVLGHRNFPSLLDTYSREAETGELWRLTWFSLLGSYFSFNPVKSSDAEQAGWAKLRSFLQRTWPLIDRQSKKMAVPDWVALLRGDPHLISDKAAYRYALDYFQGDDSAVKKLSADLAIPESSWFWHALVLSATHRCTEQSDEQFKAGIPQLIALISTRPVHRDEALELMLNRYRQCTDISVHPQLRDYVCRKDIWRNPKLRAAGLATAWNRVGDDVWQMVLQWVNKANLRDFFEVLAARRQADEGRLEFWSQYMEQISWTRLIFSSQTRMLARNNDGIRNLIAREEDSYATMSSNADVDAFMMQLGDYIVVEFSKTPNAAYVYEADQLPFEPYSREYTGSGEDLKYGFRNECAARFTHAHGWETHARSELKQLGISPDQSVNASRPSDRRSSSGARVPNVLSEGAVTSARHNSESSKGAPTDASFTMAALGRLVAQYDGAWIDDRRRATGGRLWVEDPYQDVKLASVLKAWCFRWSDARAAYYYLGA